MKDENTAKYATHGFLEDGFIEEKRQTAQGHSSSISQASQTSPFPLPFPLRLSQTQLNLLSNCPRRFQHVYLEQLAAPADFEQQERQNQGSRFHLLMQQWDLGLPVEPLVQADSQLQGWFDAFVSAAPEILMLGSDASKTLSTTLRQSEHSRTVEFEGYLLTAVYDLLISNRQQAKILDWKTYPRPQNLRWLLQNWQTRLYPFILAETSSYPPDQISMVYWFFQAQAGQVSQPQQVTIAYDATKHEQTRRDLTQLLAHLTQWLEHYRAGEPLPQVPPEARECDLCSFTVRCSRTDSRHENSQDLSLHRVDAAELNFTSGDLPRLADIQEVALEPYD